jgi:two-component system, OmpR family, response regulator
MRILLVEDEPDLAATLGKTLAESGFSVDVAADGEEALWQAEATGYDVIVLDLMIPIVDGWEVLKRIRARGNRSPVLVLTARDATVDKVRALDSGADDYLTKPFTLDELLARIRALIRRAAVSPAPVIRLADVEIETSARRVTRAGTTVDLAPKEYALLEFLALHRGTLVTRTVLYEHIYDDRDDSMSNLVDVYVSTIRRKLGHALIRTCRGSGYIIDAS